MKDTILIVDDEKSSGEAFNQLFANSKFKIEYKENGKLALEYLTKNYKSVAIILIDLFMPVVDGMVLLKVLNAKGITKLIPVVIVTEDHNNAKIEQCFKEGAVDLITKPFVPVAMKNRISSIIEQTATRRELQQKINDQTSMIKEKNQELKNTNDKLIEVMSTITEFRSMESSNHIKRVKTYTRIIAEMCLRLYPDTYKLNEDYINSMVSASALHDIGKISISDSILFKAGRLNPDEFEVIKSHTTLGCEMIQQIGDLASEELMKISYNVCRYHHERYDGSGYPDALTGEDIPIEAQIVGIADAYDSLVGERVYREAFDKDKAFNMIMNGECGAFSANILKCFETARPLLEKAGNK